ncbi:hypothetical protein QFC22_005757 [Naganishia vaughanmartiniae]|uniref:Uncharacterized protein n=1 Tax=Naganishia vaughanmartiniae TaxID=1424756 RepID=A0ACC2WSL3_9TREE|nr:hypothetical protein QFC22_005757 [Naganishia vaughanmartiniae]
MMMGEKRNGRSLWRLLFLTFCLLLSPVIAKASSQQNGEIKYDSEIASAATSSGPSSATITSTSAAHVDDASTAVFSSFEPTPLAFVSPVLGDPSRSSTSAASTYLEPAATHIAYTATISTKQLPIPCSTLASSLPPIVPTQLVREASGVPLAAIHPARTYVGNEPSITDKRRMHSTVSVVADAFEDIQNAKHLNTSESRSSVIWKGLKERAGDGTQSILSGFAEEDETRLHLLLSSQAKRLFSFVVEPFDGYVIDGGITRLPKNWDRSADPPRLHNIASEWKAKHVILDREIKMTTSQRYQEEAKSARFRRKEKMKLDVLDQKIDQWQEKSNELDSEYSLLDERKRKIAQRENAAKTSQVYHMLQICTWNYKRNTTDKDSKAVAIYFPPVHPRLPPSAFRRLLRMILYLWRIALDWLLGREERPAWLDADDMRPTDVVINTLLSIPSGKLENIVKKMRMLVKKAPNDARMVLEAHPHLANALLQAMILLNVTDPVVVTRIRYTLPVQSASTTSPGPTPVTQVTPSEAPAVFAMEESMREEADLMMDFENDTGDERYDDTFVWDDTENPLLRKDLPAWLREDPHFAKQYRFKVASLPNDMREDTLDRLIHRRGHHTPDNEAEEVDGLLNDEVSESEDGYQFVHGGQQHQQFNTHYWN